METEIKRGSVWWVSVDDSIGSEIQTGRPAVIVSGDGLNSKIDTVIVAYVTSTVEESKPNYVRIMLGGKASQVKCNQVRTVDKRRLTKFICDLDAATMRRISGALAVSMCIPIKSETVGANEKNTEESDELQTLKVELDVMKRMYDKVLNRLVEMRVAADINKAVVSDVEDIEESPIEETTEEAIEVESKLVDLNTCTRADLVQLGLDTILINNIFKHRPYDTTRDLRMVPGFTSTKWNILKAKVTVIPIVKKKPTPTPTPSPKEVKDKLNINTATYEDFVGMGLGAQTAAMVLRYRDKNGLFNSVEDLLKIPRFGDRSMKKFGSKLEV